MMCGLVYTVCMDSLYGQCVMGSLTQPLASTGQLAVAILHSACQTRVSDLLVFHFLHIH